MTSAWDRIDNELEQRAKKVLREMYLLSYAPTNRLVSKIKRLHSETKAPPESDSLYEQYVALLSPAVIKGDEKKVEKLCLRAEKDVAEYLARDEGEFRAEFVLDSDEGRAAEIVIEKYEGVPAAQVVRKLTGARPGGVVRQHVTIQWVRGIRERGPTKNPGLPRLEPESGRRYAGWRGWSDNERIEEVRRLRERGWFQNRIAAEFGVTERTLRNVWTAAFPREQAV